MPDMRFVLAAACLCSAAAHDIVGLSWCDGSPSSPPACKKASGGAGESGSNSTGFALFFDVGIDVQAPEIFTVKWGTEKSKYVTAQSTITLGRIIEAGMDTMLWMSEDGMGHWFDVAEMQEIDYWGPPFQLDSTMIDYATWPNCMWALYRNTSSSTFHDNAALAADHPPTVTVANIDESSMSLVPLFDVNVNASGPAYLSSSYSNVLLHTQHDGFTVVEKPKSCYTEGTDGGVVRELDDEDGYEDEEQQQQHLATTTRPLNSTGCVGDVVAMSFPWGWPTNDSLHVVVTRIDNNTFHANRYDIDAEACTVGHVFKLPNGWTGGATAQEPATFQWMDSLHSLVVRTQHVLFYALPGSGTSKIVDVTKGKDGVVPGLVYGMDSWPY